jgi:hypothetical protein
VASPQPEPFVQFSKELFDAILRAPFDGTHLQIVLAVVRRTYGDYGKTSAPMSLSLLREMTGRGGKGRNGWLVSCLEDLVNEGVIRIVKDANFRQPRVLALNKNYEKWGRFSVGPLPVDGPVTADGPLPVDGAEQSPYTDHPCHRARTTPVTVHGPIEDKRDIERQETHICGPDERFDELWSLLPKRHGDKKTTKSRFAKLSKRQQDRCLIAARNLRAYLDAGGSIDYIPMAENFVGGSKARYTMWVEGTPALYRRNGSHRDLSTEDLFAMAEMAEAEDVPDSDCEVMP